MSKKIKSNKTNNLTNYESENENNEVKVNLSNKSSLTTKSNNLNKKLILSGNKISCSLKLLGDFDKLFMDAFKKKLIICMRIYLINSMKLFTNDNNNTISFNESSKIYLLYIINRFMYEILQY